MKSDSFAIDRVQYPAARICRLTIAFVWFYHGLVPKLLGPAADELTMDHALGLSDKAAVQLAYAAGVCEIAFALMILYCRHRKWPLWLTIAAMIGLLAYAAWASPSLLAGAFNPVTTNVCVIALAAVALLLMRHQCSASSLGSSM